MGFTTASSYIHFHILRLFDVLPNFPFTTSETMRDFTYKHGICEMPNDLGPRILGNWDTLGKGLNFKK